MNRHLLRLIWNRKRYNLLLSVEIFFSFVVVLIITTMIVNIAANWLLPLGYSIDGLWRVNVGRPDANDVAAKPMAAATLKNVLTALRALPGVQGAAGIAVPPYSSNDWVRVGGEPRVFMGANAATDELATLMDMEIVAGRWFSLADAGTSARPVVINQSLKRRLFPDGEAVGQLLPFERKATLDGWMPPQERVVGVISDFRKGGELATSEHVIFGRVNMDKAGLDYEVFPGTILLRVAPGTTAEFEETIIKTAQSQAPSWQFSVGALAADREASFRSYQVAIGVVGIITGFLVLMVGLGLTGVVWQMVTERTREFGLRRAKGAAAVNIQRQVLIELLLVASLAIVPGVLLAAQIPVLPKPRDWVVPDGIFLLSVVISAVTIYLVVLACGWYPSRLATRIQPAEALHYE
jgi:putative ABC transport system permease protein